MPLLSERVIFTCKETKGSKARLSLVKYTASRSPPTHGTSLLCIHGIGGYKEEWLPFLKHLFEANNVNLAEAWCVDLYSHGDSLPYNKDLVMSNPEMADLDLCWRHIVDILDSGLIQRTHPDRRLVVIGNSVGDQSVVGVVRNYAQRGQPPPFSMAILLAPVFITGEVAVKVTGRLRKPIAAKKWKWESRDIAEDYIKTTFPSKFWDKEMQRILLDYGMLHSFEGSQLKNAAFIEAQCYPRPDLPLSEEHNRTAMATHQGWAFLPECCKQVPVHFVCGDRHDFVPEKFEIEMLKRVKDLVKSVQRISGAGHMLLHENPKACAAALKLILDQSQLPTAVKL